MNKKLVAVFVFLGAMFVPGVIGAATFEVGESYLLSGTTVVEDNLYVAGGDVTLSGTIQGDLLGAGGVVSVSGDVRDDIALVGGNISIAGNTTGDVRMVGGDILISNGVGGDLTVAGGSVKVLDTVTVGKDVGIAGGYIVFYGATNGNASFAGGEIIIDGKIAGDVEIYVDEKLTIGENTQIGGSLIYHSGSEDNLVMHDSAIVGGGVQFEKSKIAEVEKEKIAGMFAVIMGAFLVLKLISISIAAVLFVLVFKRFSFAVASKADEAFWLQMLRGFIILIMIPVSAIVLFMTAAGYYLGLMLLGIYAIVLMLGAIYSGVIFGVLTIKRFKKEDRISVTWMHALFGVVALYLIKLIPVIGWIACLALTLVALGSLFQMFREKVWNHR